MKQMIVMTAALLLCLMPILLTAQENGVVTKDLKKIVVVKNGNDMTDQELKDCISTEDCTISESCPDGNGRKKIIVVKNTTDMKDLDKLSKMKIEITQDDVENDSPDAPFFGIYPGELDFPKAQALNYPYSYGILITGIVPNSPAYKFRLIEDDIIMEIGGKKALNLKEFDKLKSAYRAGDTVILTIFRAGEEKRIDFVFGAREVKEISITTDGGETKVAKKYSVGSLGGSWIPMWYQADMEDVNALIQSIGFGKLPEDGVLTQGLGGKGNIGKGWFIGGQLSSYDTQMKKGETNTDFTNYMNYDLTMGGVTLDKRFALSKNIITSVGFMLGAASHSVELMHTNGTYNWPTATSSTSDIMGTNSYASMSRSYILAQPRAEVMVRLLSWLGMRAEVGYLYGYAPRNGWTVKHMETESYEMSGSPDTPLQGLTVSIGPWFGF